MSGLVGLIGDGSIAELERMAARMPYRGFVHAWSPAPRVYFGELSRMPRDACARGDGCVAIDMSGHDIDTPADIEHRFRLHGDAAAARLRGFFALAWWDENRRVVKLICDRYGYKTLYVARPPGRIAFASDLKALLALPDVEARVDRDVLQMYVRSRSFPSERSLLASVRPVGGANIWILGDTNSPEREPYWVPTRRVRRGRSFETAAAELRATLESVVHRQLLGRDRVALALSGGLDSVALLGIARKVRPDLDIRTYTVGHGDDDRDITRARSAAEYFGTPHHEFFLKPESLPEEMAQLVWLTEDLTGREEAALQQVLAREIAAHERAYLAGHGADAAFAGMPRHRLLWLRDRAPPPLRGALNELFLYTQRRSAPRTWLGRQLTRAAFDGTLPPAPTIVGANEISLATDFQTLDQYCCANVSWIEGMRFHEPIETAKDLTLLAPFFDPAVLDFSLSCPTSHLIDARRQKRVLRAALTGVLPAVLRERKKTIQRLKHDALIADVLDEFAARLRLHESLATRGLLSPEYLQTLQARDRGNAYSSERLHTLWALVCAELWLRQFIDQRGAPEDARLATARSPITVPAEASASQPAPIP